LSRFLALDWDQNQLHVVAGHTGRRGLIVDRAAAWRVETPATAEGAELLGRALKDMLKAAGIAPAPVLACVSRSHFVVKEIWHPPVAAVEEAALIRFQAGKELADNTEDVVIDYTSLGPVGNGSNEQRSLALALRKSVLATYQALCKAANLPLAAVAPRAFGTAACLERDGGASFVGQTVEPPVSPTAPAAVLVIAEDWAEFAVVRGGTVLYTRALQAGGNLAGEVRRNLALFSGQNAGTEPVGAVYVAGNGEHALLRSQLHAMLGLPALPLDPFAREERLDLVGTERRGGFTGGVGLLHLKAAGKALPVDFAHPKEPKPPADPNKKKVFVAAAVLLLAVLGLGFYANRVLAARAAEIADLNFQKTTLETTLTRLQPDAKHLEVLKDWNVTAVSWLDEIYDLAARFPKKPGMKVTKVEVVPVVARSNKEKPPARLLITGLYYPKDKGYLDDFVQRVNTDRKWCTASLLRINDATNQEQQKGLPQQEFRIQVDVRQRPTTAYSARLELPPPQQKKKAGGWGDFGGDN
jgi:Tfp pilus assembly PilM family ATPase